MREWAYRDKCGEHRKKVTERRFGNLWIAVFGKRVREG